MTVGPTVLRNNGLPFLTMASAVLVVYFLVKAVLIPGAAAVFSLIMGAIVALVGFWWYRRSQRANVVIDAESFTVNSGRRSKSYQRAQVESVNLSSATAQVKFVDGTGIVLPLEGRALVQAGILLSPDPSS